MKWVFMSYYFLFLPQNHLSSGVLLTLTVIFILMSLWVCRERTISVDNHPFLPWILWHWWGFLCTLHLQFNSGLELKLDSWRIFHLLRRPAELVSLISETISHCNVLYLVIMGNAYRNCLSLPGISCLMFPQVDDGLMLFSLIELMMKMKGKYIVLRFVQKGAWAGMALWEQVICLPRIAASFWDPLLLFSL